MVAPPIGVNNADQGSFAHGLLEVIQSVLTKLSVDPGLLNRIVDATAYIARPELLLACLGGVLLGWIGARILPAIVAMWLGLDQLGPLFGVHATDLPEAVWIGLVLLVTVGAIEAGLKLILGRSVGGQTFGTAMLAVFVLATTIPLRLLRWRWLPRPR